MRRVSQSPIVLVVLPSFVRDGVRAGAVAAVVSGLPSTLHALATRRDPFGATLAAGSLLMPHEHRRGVLLLAAVPVHLTVSLAWGVLLAAVLPPRRRVAWGAFAGLAIAAIDLGMGRALPTIRALPTAPQLADHLLYGATVGAVLDYLRPASPSSL